MPRGDKSSYTDKQKREAGHIEESCEERGVSGKTAARRAWATVNKQDGGGRKRVAKATGGGAAKRASVRTPSPGGKSPAAEKSSGARRKSAPARTSPGSRRSARA